MDILDSIDDYYSYPKKPQSVQWIENRLIERIHNSYRETGKTLPYVTVTEADYTLIEDFADKVKEWSKRTSPKDPLSNWKTTLGVQTARGFVEIRKEQKS